MSSDQVSGKSTEAGSAAATGGLAAAMDRIGWTRVHWAVAIMVLAGMFFDALEQDTTGAIVEGLKASFGMGTADLAFLNTIMIVGGLVGRIGTGYLADRKGRRYALAFNLLLYTLGGLISAVAPNEFFLQVTRFIVGIGLGGEFTVGLTTRGRDRRDPVPRHGRGVTEHLVRRGRQLRRLRLLLLVLGTAQRRSRRHDTAWRWTYVILAVPALLVVFFRRYLPESPAVPAVQGPHRGRQRASRVWPPEASRACASRVSRSTTSPRPTSRCRRQSSTPRVQWRNLKSRTIAHRRGIVDVLRRSGHPAVPDADLLVARGYSLSDSWPSRWS